MACGDKICLLEGTPPVGIFVLKARSMDDSILGKMAAGQNFKLGRGKFWQGTAEAARALLDREFPQASTIEIPHLNFFE